MNSTERNIILQRLVELRERTNVIISLYGSETSLLSPAKQREAKTLFASLKQEVKQEAHRFDVQRERARMSKLEITFFRPAVVDVRVAFSRIHVNTKPDGKWLSNLLEARSDLNFWISSIKSSEKKSSAERPPGKSLSPGQA